jgi:hypothetical protein
MKSDHITQSGYIKVLIILKKWFFFYSSLQKKSLFRRKLGRRIYYTLPDTNFIQAETHEEGAGAAVAIATTTGSSATCTTTTYSSAIRVAKTDPSPTTDDHSIVSPTACLGEGVTDLDEYV